MLKYSPNISNLYEVPIIKNAAHFLCFSLHQKVFPLNSLYWFKKRQIIYFFFKTKITFLATIEKIEQCLLKFSANYKYTSQAHQPSVKSLQKCKNTKIPLTLRLKKNYVYLKWK